MPHYLHRYTQVPASDGYIGFWSLLFAVNGGLVLVRLPRFDDDDCEDGTTTDRCIACYTANHVRPGEVDKVARELRKHLALHPMFQKISPPAGCEIQSIL
jgi:hypothetical protein